MTTSVTDIHLALRQKVNFEVVANTEAPDRLRIMGRIPQDRDGRNLNNWILVMDRLLDAMETRPWTVDLSKNYFKKAPKSRIVFAWRLIFQSDGLASHYADIVNLIKTAPSTARAEITSMPLYGSNAGRNDTAGGKRGAGPAGTVAVGPMAVMQKNMGG